MPISSTFKSSTRRGTRDSGGYSDHNSVPKAPPVRKRSQSVSSVSRSSKQQLDSCCSDFVNKRENPLFCSSPSPPYLEDESTEKRNNGGDVIEKIVDVVGDRGRSSSRNGECGVRKGIGRSLSRVRGRSVSRGYVYESEKEQHIGMTTNIQNDDIKFANLEHAHLSGNGSDTYGQIKNSSTRNYCEAVDSSEDNDANWEIGTSISFLPEVEERTIEPVREQNRSFGAYLSEGESVMSGRSETVRSEVRRAISVQDDMESAIQRNKVSYIATRNIAETPPDLVNPGAVELVLDIRRAYARKLEESEERARKLRDDLAVEEHRGEELSRILKEVLPDPKISNPHKSRQGRKRSTERKRNSKRLSEEAMAYFEECVSISTFDSSDFSAPGEPAHCLAAGPSSIRAGLQENPSMNLTPYTPRSCSKSNQQMESSQDEFSHSYDESKLSASSYEHTMYTTLCKDKSINPQHHRLFKQETNEDLEELRDIDSFLSNCKKESTIDILCCADSTTESRRGRYDAVEYNNLHGGGSGGIESLVFDRVLYRNSVEFGGLHLCAGSISFPFSPFW